MKKKLMVVSGIVLGIFLILDASIYIRINKIADHILSQEIETISFNDYEDGVYQGDYYHNDIGITVHFQIESGEIKDISYENHQHGQGEPAEAISRSIIEEQSLVIDDVTGATISSRCIKLAIIEGIEGGENE
ncbi:MAG TPA: FMN-binding protein [Candidatus Izemoplasmatales bacterium]|nr:FMN-binding protein [Candidatus Izemoplasmatales bacterium]